MTARARVAPGLRRLAPEALPIKTQADHFGGLPNGLSPGQALAAFKRAAAALGLGAVRDLVVPQGRSPWRAGRRLPCSVRRDDLVERGMRSVEGFVSDTERATQSAHQAPAQLVLSVEDVARVLRSEVLAGHRDQPVGLVAGHLFDRDRQTCDAFANRAIPRLRVVPLAALLDQEEALSLIHI